ncbi:uncharacterized protein LOC5521408 isoform X1 [Nematostella vectensis]|uniref:uncharacterized protein LOC5521408 isoform X1 n=1 Tax=Nematostella vectensis TaxID=45351 RepID=UPI00207768A5|nr:uncharacterized protein LOC5521408 isoform X1 [Nematostella vectensis]
MMASIFFGSTSAKSLALSCHSSDMSSAPLGFRLKFWSPNGGVGITSLECYHCNSGSGFDDCTYYQTNMTCRESEDRCIKASWDLGTVGTVSVGYIKGCTTRDMCSTDNYTLCHQNDGYVKCETYCCEGKLCNGVRGISNIGTIGMAFLFLFAQVGNIDW